VGLSVAVPGFANKIAHGLLGELPFGAISLVRDALRTAPDGPVVLVLHSVLL
jgi:hypothetical protein